MKKPYDRRTREQKKADDSALIAWTCFVAAGALLLGSLLVLDVGGAEVPEEAPEETVVEEVYDPAWDVPATESAVCTDVFLGEYIATAYCACSKCCGWNTGITATGTQAAQGRTIAVDPNDIPYGSRVVVIFADGTQHTYIAEDTGGAIKEKRIDIFFDSHTEALQFGVQKVMVYREELSE